MDSRSDGYRCQWRNPHTGKPCGAYNYPYKTKGNLQRHHQARHALPSDPLQIVSYAPPVPRCGGSLANELAVAQKQVMGVASILQRRLSLTRFSAGSRVIAEADNGPRLITVLEPVSNMIASYA